MKDLRKTTPYKECLAISEDCADVFARLIQYFMPVALNPRVCKFSDPTWLFFRDNPCFLTSCLRASYDDARVVLRIAIKHGVLKDDGDGLGRLNAFEWIHKELKV